MMKIKRYFPVLLSLILILAFFIPRYFAHKQFDVLEDELLSIQTNIDYSFIEQLNSPDPAHPMLWYILMELPTSLIGISHGVFYYRLIQVLLLLVMIIITKKFFTKYSTNSFFITFLLLIFSNVTILHLSIQHRMFALIFGISILYCFAWIDIIKSQKPASKMMFFLLGIIATVGFLTNYSILWILPIWPALYIIDKFSVRRIKQVLIGLITFLAGISWYLPTFYRNTIGSISSNQWAPQVNLFNTKELIAEYFGLLSVTRPLHALNPLFYLFVGTILLLLFLWIIDSKNESKFKKVIIPLILSFLSFVIISKITGNRLFYTRTSIPIIFVAYLIIAEISTTKKLLTWVLIGAIVIFQLSQFLLYFFLIPTNKSYSVFNYVHHPQAYFQSYDFPPGSCIVSLPSWNYLSLQYFFGKKVKVIPTYDFFINVHANTCEHVFLMDQTSVDRNVIRPYFDRLNTLNVSYTSVLEHENQLLYFLNMGRATR